MRVIQGQPLQKKREIVKKISVFEFSPPQFLVIHVCIIIALVQFRFMCAFYRNLLKLFSIGCRSGSLNSWHLWDKNRSRSAQILNQCLCNKMFYVCMWYRCILRMNSAAGKCNCTQLAAYEFSRAGYHVIQFLDLLVVDHKLQNLC